MLVENQPLIPSLPRLEAGREDGFHQCLPGLEILAADRDVVLAREFEQRGNILREVRRAVGEGHAA
jgi:hypothetical protein